MPPTQPPPCQWVLPDPLAAESGEPLVGVGADLAPGTLIAAYSRGIFPMHVATGDLGWWSPDPRAVIPLDGLRVSASLRQSARRMDITVDQAFEDVMRGCSRPQAEDMWITEDFVDAYGTLHAMGWAHSVEVWRAGELVGGLYGVEVGGLFAGESMFHRVRDASKVAMLGLVEALGGAQGAREGRVLDAQWRTDHLGRMGALEISRSEYVRRIEHAVRLAPRLSVG